MIPRKKSVRQRQKLDASLKEFPFFVEALEERRLLSASIAHHALQASKAHHTAKHASKTHSSSTTAASTTATASTATTAETADTSTNLTSSEASTTTAAATSSDTPTANCKGAGQVVDTLAFDLTPTAVQNGLTALASTDGLTVPTPTELVHLGNSNGIETYSLDYTTTGTESRITVDATGTPVTAPTKTTITWADLSGTGASADAPAAAEITTIATALSLTAPADATVIHLSTSAAGTIYSVQLSSSSSTETEYEHGQNISVDANGNPVGNQNLPFSTLPSAIQGFINANIPTGATALDAASTQTVHVRTIDGIVTYATDFAVSGTTTTVVVDLAGAVVTPTDPTTSTFTDIPQAAQTELQALATAQGITAAIPTTQTVTVFAELNGTTVYTVTLADTDSTTSETYTITLASDQLGDPTVPPGRGSHGFGDHGFGGSGFGGGGFGGPGGDWGPGSGGTSSDDSGSSGTGSTTPTLSAAFTRGSRGGGGFGAA